VTETGTVFSDDDVVQSVRDGNTRNFEILINRYKSKLINFIHKMIFDYDEAQSLAQDVFLKVYESIRKYKSQDNFQAFIFTIAKNMTLNHIKKQKRVLLFSSFLPGNSEDRHFRSEETQQAAMEKDRQEEMMKAALTALKENQRLALIMKVYLDFSYKRIADITGWSIPKIETLISRAKGNLKDFIRANTGPEGNFQEKMQEKGNKNVLKVRVV
jgi:RNA polymerase sigma-70 factor (ECF subfamily)